MSRAADVLPAAREWAGTISRHATGEAHTGPRLGLGLMVCSEISSEGNSLWPVSVAKMTVREEALSDGLKEQILGLQPRVDTASVLDPVRNGGSGDSAKVSPTGMELFEKMDIGYATAYCEGPSVNGAIQEENMEANHVAHMEGNHEEARLVEDHVSVPGGDTKLLNGTEEVLPGRNVEQSRSPATDHSGAELLRMPNQDYVLMERQQAVTINGAANGQPPQNGSASVVDIHRVVNSPGKDTQGVPEEAKSELGRILDKLISFDPLEIFLDPVDDSFAPNYSKIIKTPMCFVTMQRKVRERGYPTWRSFVDDFERICYNAMKYNQKRSKIWIAASTLLKQGKKELEQYVGMGNQVDGIGLPDGTVLEKTMKCPPRGSVKGARAFAGKGRAGKGLSGKGFFGAGRFAEDGPYDHHGLSMQMSPPSGISSRIKSGVGKGVRGMRVPGKGIRDGDAYLPLESLPVGAREGDEVKDLVGFLRPEEEPRMDPLPRGLAADIKIYRPSEDVPGAEVEAVLTGHLAGLEGGGRLEENVQPNNLESEGLGMPGGGVQSPVIVPPGSDKAVGRKNEVQADLDARHGRTLGVGRQYQSRAEADSDGDKEGAQRAADGKLSFGEGKNSQIDVLGDLSDTSFEMYGVRPDADDRAIECSSSFEDTMGYGEPDVDMEGEEDADEAQSQHMAGRDGNGAGLGDEDEMFAQAARRKPMNPEWKTYRRGIEWRCRWLELRMKELKCQEERYLQILERMQAAKGVGHSRAPQSHPPKEAMGRADSEKPPPLSEAWDAGEGAFAAPPVFPTTQASTPAPVLPLTHPLPAQLEPPPCSNLGVPQVDSRGSSLAPGQPPLVENVPHNHEGPVIEGLNPTLEDDHTAVQSVEATVRYPTGRVGAAGESFPVVAAFPYGNPATLKTEQIHTPIIQSQTEGAFETAGDKGGPGLKSEGPERSALPLKFLEVQVGVAVDATVHGAPKNEADESDGGEHAARVWAVWEGRSQGKRLLRRRPRKKEEDREDAEDHLSRHPLFSRYIKRRKPRGEEEEEDDGAQGHQAQRGVEGGHQLAEQLIEEPCEPIELLLGRVEALQARIQNARYQLARGVPNRKAAQSSQRVPPRAGGGPPRPPMYPAATPRAGGPTRTGGSLPPTPKAISNVNRLGGGASVVRPPSPAVSPLTPGPWSGSPSPKLGQGLSRRRAADYDINNMVMPVSVGAKYIEQVRHEHIETPQWRSIEELPKLEATGRIADGVPGQMGGGVPDDERDPTESSEEDTDDESYERRHAPLEARERQRYLPPPRKGGDGEMGPSKTKGKGKGKSTPNSGKNLEREGSPSSPPPLFSGTIPQGKRRKREWGPLNSPVGSPVGLLPGSGPSRIGGAVQGAPPATGASGEGRPSGSSDGLKSGASSGSKGERDGHYGEDSGSGGQKDLGSPDEGEPPRLRPPTRASSGGSGGGSGEGGGSCATKRRATGPVLRGSLPS